VRLFQNFSFGTATLKIRSFAGPQAEKLQEPVTKQPVLEQAQVALNNSRLNYSVLP
jgi:hypothetical protein